MKLARRRGVAVIIATLIMIAAAALFTSIMLYWGQAYLGQSTTNLGGAIFRSNNAAAEGISIDTVLFTKDSPSNAYTVTLYARNFGDTPVKIAGVHFKNLQSGAATPGYDCEVTPSHLTIVARAVAQIVLSSNATCSPALGASSTFAPAWNGASISIRVNTEAGTSYQNNYSIPP